MQRIRSYRAPTPGNYSQAVVVDVGAGFLIYTAGQTGNLPALENKDEHVVEGGIGPQTNRALLNLEAVLQAAGASIGHIVKTTVYLEDLACDKAEFERAYVEFFSKRTSTTLPARSIVGVKNVPLAFEPTVVEIEAIAYVPKGAKW
jgi:2-iminobutanoate/2-iminopropanoate deaminase